MKVLYSTEVIEFLKELSLKDHTRIQRVRETFERFGFGIGQKYIKKITKSGLWELRAGKIRVFVIIRGDIGYGVHAIYKKSQKTPIKDLNLAERRGKQL